MEFRLIILSVACFSCLVPSALSGVILPTLAAKGVVTAKLAAKGLAALAIKGAAIKGAGLLAAKSAALNGAAVLAEKAVAAKSVAVGAGLPAIIAQKNVIGLGGGVRFVNLPSFLDVLSNLWSGVQFSTDLVGNTLNRLRAQQIARTPFVYEVIAAPRVFPYPMAEELVVTSDKKEEKKSN